MAEARIPTPSYRWIRDLYERLAKEAGCDYRFEPVRDHAGGPIVSYTQVISGDAHCVNAVVRAGDSARQKIEVWTRGKFPGTTMFSRAAANYRAAMVEYINPELELAA